MNCLISFRFFGLLASVICSRCLPNGSVVSLVTRYEVRDLGISELTLLERELEAVFLEALEDQGEMS